jgi:hypothetical protein
LRQGLPDDGYGSYQIKRIGIEFIKVGFKNTRSAKASTS